MPCDEPVHSGSYERAPSSLEALATDPDLATATCLVCDAPARVLVEVRGDLDDGPSEVVLCAECGGLVESADRTALASRISESGGADDVEAFSRWLVGSTGRAVEIAAPRDR